MILAIFGVYQDATVPAGTIPPKVPTRQDILLARGEPLTITLTVYKQNHTAKDISGHTVKLGVRQFRDDGAAKVTAAGVLTTPIEGKASIALTAADTVDLFELTKYFYDVQLIDSLGARAQVVPFSVLQILPIVNRPGE